MVLRKGEKRMTYEEAKQKLMPVGQEHLLQYFEELGDCLLYTSPSPRDRG